MGLRHLVERVVPSGSAFQLASLRVVVPAMILTTQEVRHAAIFASSAPALRVAPEGLGWFVHMVPIGPVWATVAQAACVSSALASIAGVWARPALAILTAATFYLFAISQLSGAVWHDMHLLWMSALLAASPSADALAFDRRGGSSPPDGPAYGAPLTVARLLLGCIYFFPGFHKLHTSGLAWALSDNLRNQLWWKWLEHGTLPSFRVDRMPWLLHASGLAVLAFELSFPLLVLTRRGRPWAAACGLVFHLFAGFLFQIAFVSLWALYVAIIDVGAIRGALLWRLRRVTATARVAPRADEPPQRFEWTTVLVGGALITGAAVQGIRGQMRSFPFACYPTFEWIVGTEVPDLRIQVVTEDGRTTTLPLTHARTQREWGEIWSLTGVTSTVDPARLRAYYTARSRSLGSTAPGRVVRVRMTRIYRSAVPEERGRPPTLGPILTEFAPFEATR